MQVILDNPRWLPGPGNCGLSDSVWLRADFSNIIRSKVDWGAGGGWRGVEEAGPSEASRLLSPLGLLSLRLRLVWSRTPETPEAPVWRDLAPAPVTGVTTIRDRDSETVTLHVATRVQPASDSDPRVSWPHLGVSVCRVKLGGLNVKCEGVMEWWLLQTACQWKFN